LSQGEIVELGFCRKRKWSTCFCRKRKLLNWILSQGK